MPPTKLPPRLPFWSRGGQYRTGLSGRMRPRPRLASAGVKTRRMLGVSPGPSAVWGPSSVTLSTAGLLSNISSVESGQPV
jgi:hypothetical protein